MVNAQANCNGYQVHTQNGHIPRAAVQNVMVRISFGRIALIITLLPFCSLLICLLTCMLFQFEQVNTTFCGATNYLPSISAVTGARPQTHLWRFCIALHCTPRFLIALMYRATYRQNLEKLHPTGPYAKFYNRVIRINFSLGIVENIALLLVSVISSPDNYEVHEKCFVVFLLTSILHMMISSFLYPALFFQPFLTDDLRKRSLSAKRKILLIIVLLTIGLSVSFFRHRRYCAPGAFSYFAFCEYWIAILNMAYHLTCFWDFTGKELIIAGSPKEDHVLGESCEYLLHLSKNGMKQASH